MRMSSGYELEKVRFGPQKATTGVCSPTLGYVGAKSKPEDPKRFKERVGSVVGQQPRRVRSGWAAGMTFEFLQPNLQGQVSH